MSVPLRVVKVGGSLFQHSDLAARLNHWLSTQPLGCNVLLAGGGELADVVRGLDQRLSLGERASHWLCIDLMDVMANVLHSLLAQAQLIQDHREIVRAVGVSVFLSGSFLREDEPNLPGEKLPESWQVTSDSIAARLASVIEADELVLLKSAPPPPDWSFEALRDCGYVDEFFPLAAQGVKRIRMVDLNRSGRWQS